MRYTTVIDISELPAIYHNRNARALYFHMALKCGYHDDDRDILDCSVRRLAASAGLTVSATRHALHVLQGAELIAKDGNKWRVKKWILDKKPTARKQSQTISAQQSNADEMRRQEIEAHERTRRLDAWFAQADRQQLSEALAKLQSGRPFMVDGARMYPTERAIEAIRNKLTKL